MRTLQLVSVAAALGLAGTVFAQAQEPSDQAQTEPTPQTSTEISAPSAASSPHQRQATETTASESATTDGTEPSSSASEHQREAISATRVADASVTDKPGEATVGMKVMTSGESLGVVQAVLRDSKGDASYAVISHGAKRTAVPWATVQSMMRDNKLVIERSQLEQAPVLANDKTPDASSGTWSRDADKYWRTKAAMNAPE
jgi:hypothetical protein